MFRWVQSPILLCNVGGRCCNAARELRRHYPAWTSRDSRCCFCTTRDSRYGFAEWPVFADYGGGWLLLCSGDRSPLLCRGRKPVLPNERDGSTLICDLDRWTLLRHAGQGTFLVYSGSSGLPWESMYRSERSPLLCYVGMLGVPRYVARKQTQC